MAALLGTSEDSICISCGNESSDARMQRRCVSGHDRLNCRRRRQQTVGPVYFSGGCIAVFGPAKSQTRRQGKCLAGDCHDGPVGKRLDGHMQRMDTLESISKPLSMQSLVDRRGCWLTYSLDCTPGRAECVR